MFYSECQRCVVASNSTLQSSRESWRPRLGQDAWKCECSHTNTHHLTCWSGRYEVSPELLDWGLNAVAGGPMLGASYGSRMPVWLYRRATHGLTHCCLCILQNQLFCGYSIHNYPLNPDLCSEVKTNEWNGKFFSTMVAPNEVSVDAAIASAISELERIFSLS